MKTKVLVPIVIAIAACGVLLIAGASVVLPMVHVVGKLLVG